MNNMEEFNGAVSKSSLGRSSTGSNSPEKNANQTDSFMGMAKAIMGNKKDKNHTKEKTLVGVWYPEVIEGDSLVKQLMFLNQTAVGDKPWFLRNIHSDLLLELDLKLKVLERRFLPSYYCSNPKHPVCLYVDLGGGALEQDYASHSIFLNLGMGKFEIVVEY